MQHYTNHTSLIQVILPLSLPSPLTYSVAPDLVNNLQIGQRVVVSLKQNKLYTAIVYKIHVEAQDHINPLPIEYILDKEPVIQPLQLTFWDWMQQYYMCTPGDILSAALPNSLKLNSDTQIVLRKELEDYSELTDKEWMIYEYLLKNQKNSSITNIQHHLQQKNVLHWIEKLSEKKIIETHQRIIEKYKPQTKKYIKLHHSMREENAFQNIMGMLEKRSPKQMALCMLFIRECGSNNWFETEIEKKHLLQLSGFSENILQSLLKKNVFQEIEKQHSRLVITKNAQEQEIILRKAQEKALDEIHQAFNTHNTALLWGVTSSGKTELYIKYIENILSQQKQVLFLLPEIGLSTQMIDRLRKYFGNDVGIYHSKFSDAERAEIWKKQLSNTPYKIVLGTRSSIFLPFHKLGLIIVDEEHEYSYKQISPAPRYNARDSAIMLGNIHKAKVLLGSATPSLETFYQASQNKYGLIQLTERYHNTPLPNIECIDLKKYTKQKKMKSHFSEYLLEKMQETLHQNQKVILFQNRRGFATYIQCEACDHIEMCEQCDVSLTYHKHEHVLRCHYCGFTKKMEVACRHCGSFSLKIRGFGTEKIEDELHIFFPNARIDRMDLDTTRKKKAFENMLHRFDQEEIDILVGTQMITKGLDFKKVGLVSVLNADNLLYFPDFRTQERAFQLLIQVAGRAGRDDKPSNVYIQTYTIHHKLFEKIKNYDLEGMYAEELQERKNYFYPPYSRLIKITYLCKEIELLEKISKNHTITLKKTFDFPILGPEFPIIKRIKNNFQMETLIKLPKTSKLELYKNQLQKISREFFSIPENKKCRYIIDVDPL